MSQCHVSARFVAKPGMGDQLCGAVLKLIPTVRAEDGCIRYDFHRNLQNQDIFLFYEIWADVDALKRHGESAHMKGFRSECADLMAEPGVVEVWSAVDVKE